MLSEKHKSILFLKIIHGRYLPKVDCLLKRWFSFNFHPMMIEARKKKKFIL